MKKDKWMQGYICAVATMVRSHDVGTPGREALQNAGLCSVQLLREYGADDFDIDALRPMIKEIQSKWKYLKRDIDAERVEGSKDA
jgi:hypothetical protein